MGWSGMTPLQLVVVDQPAAERRGHEPAALLRLREVLEPERPEQRAQMAS